MKHTRKLHRLIELKLVTDSPSLIKNYYFLKTKDTILFTVKKNKPI